MRISHVARNACTWKRIRAKRYLSTLPPGDKSVPENAIVFTDGAARGNPGHGGAGVVIVDADNSTDILRRYYLYLGPNVTNNVAEYMALLTGIRSAKSLGIRTCIFKTDSELVARQVNGIYKTKSPLLGALKDNVCEEIKGFKSSQVEHIPREQNNLADELANIALDKACNKSSDANAGSTWNNVSVR